MPNYAGPYGLFTLYFSVIVTSPYVLFTMYFSVIVTGPYVFKNNCVSIFGIELIKVPSLATSVLSLVGRFSYCPS